MIKTKTFDGSVLQLLTSLNSVFIELGYYDLIVTTNDRTITFPSDGTKTMKLVYQSSLSTGPQLQQSIEGGSATVIGSFVTGNSSATMDKIYYTPHGIMMAYKSTATTRHSIIIGKLEDENENKPYGVVGCYATTTAAYPLSYVGAFDIVNQMQFQSYKIVAQDLDRIHPPQEMGLLPVIVQENGKFFDSIYFNMYTPTPNVGQPYQYEMNGHTYLTDGCYSILDE